MDIGGFDIKRKLFTNECGLSVFEVVETKTKRTFILRLADFSNKSMDFKKAQWQQLQEEYQQVITDFSHLPRIEQRSQVEPDRLYTLLTCEEGAALVEKGPLGSDEMKQLLAAVSHLHENKIIHGSISPENIWITAQGRVILYGAGEAKVLEGKPRLGTVSDVRSLIKIIRSYTTLSELIMEKLELEDPMTVAELELILASGEKNKGISDDNKLATFFERKSMNQKAEATERARKKTVQGRGLNSRMVILGGVVLAVLIVGVYLLI